MPVLALAVSLAVAATGAHAAAVEVRVRDTAGAPLADAAVFALASTGAAEVKGARTVTIEQVEREFVPYVSIVQTGTEVTFPNRDPILHHVYSFSPAKTFEIKLYTGKSPGKVVFDKPGVVVLGCNIHDWMTAYVVVVSTPHYARTGAGGTASLRDLPAGSYELRAWHPRQTTALAPQLLALDATASTRADLVIDVLPPKTKFKPPLDRLRY